MSESCGVERGVAPRPQPKPDVQVSKHPAYDGSILHYGSPPRMTVFVADVADGASETGTATFASTVS